MYGLVNRAVEQMVTKHHGAETWERIKAEAGVSELAFISNQQYADEITYRLVGAASRILATPAEQILEAFGEHWVLVTAQEGYGALMHANGRTLPEFLSGLNQMHSRVTLFLPELRPPHFECSKVTETSLELHYYSHRPGLSPFVAGLVKGLGRMLGTPATVSLLAHRDAGCDHEIYRVEWSRP